MGRDRLPPPPPDVLCQALNVQTLSIEWLAGDGSDRCYYRIISKELRESLVLMQLSEHDAALLRDNGYDWVHIGQLLAQQGIRVPNLQSTLPDYAALVIEDYGNTMLETEVQLRLEKNQDFSPLYNAAIAMIHDFLRISSSSDAVWCKRSFDRERYHWELHFFRKKYLDLLGAFAFTPSEEKAFIKDVDALSEVLDKQSHYFVHRDFHSRNLMMRSNELAVIDFQDARLGAPSYDLVSLVFDSYVPLKMEDRRKFLFNGLQLFAETARQEELNEWPAVLLQRQLKAIGSFGYLTHEKKRGDYLKYVPPALALLLETPEIRDERWPFLSGDLLYRMNDLLT